ncbi:DUF4359 domain-containing protein [Chamaesiphon sp.]|uniref:DUF4359 domain-containing protein n=1 Tax=Chamaesiphon sp. TaxID=2814140 RepID=UPI00359396D5
MTRWQLFLLGMLGLCGLGITNPDRVAYEIYATQQISNLARDECSRAPAGLGILIQEPCRAAIAAYTPQIRQLLAATTTRQNWILFSIYRSDISIPVVNLDAHVESIGILNNFFTYKAP